MKELLVTEYNVGKAKTQPEGRERRWFLVLDVSVSEDVFLTEACFRSRK